MSIFTVGLYEIYWFVQNWQAVKKVEKKNISPFWRALFAVFFCYEMFRKVLASAKKQGFSKNYSAGLLATVYIILLLVGNAWGRLEFQNPGVDLIFWLIASATFIPLVAIQEAINFNNKKLNLDKVFAHKYHAGEIVLIIFGVILFLIILLGILLPE